MAFMGFSLPLFSGGCVLLIDRSIECREHNCIQQTVYSSEATTSVELCRIVSGPEFVAICGAASSAEIRKQAAEFGRGGDAP
jgi:hypothetical protein